MPTNTAPAMRSPSGSWPAATNRSQLASPTPDDTQVNGTRVASPTTNGRPSRQDKKRLSLAFLTKEFLTSEPEKDKDAKADNNRQLTDNDTSASASTRSHSKGDSKHRLSLNFMNPTPSSPQPEALPSFPTNTVNHSNQSQGSLHRTPSQKRPETIKSMKSDKSLASRTGSVKKRLSFMNITKKSSKNSVRGRFDDTLVEE